MKASMFEPTRYFPPHQIPTDWPVPGKYYDAEAGAHSYASMMRRVALLKRSASTG
jgi:hypothetical protein